MSYDHTWATRDLHVAASDRECIRHVRRKINQPDRSDPDKRAARRDFYHGCLAAHHDHQGLVRQFRL